MKRLEPPDERLGARRQDDLKGRLAGAVIDSLLGIRDRRRGRSRRDQKPAEVVVPHPPRGGARVVGWFGGGGGGNSPDVGYQCRGARARRAHGKGCPGRAHPCRVHQRGGSSAPHGVEHVGFQRALRGRACLQPARSCRAVQGSLRGPCHDPRRIRAHLTTPRRSVERPCDFTSDPNVLPLRRGRVPRSTAILQPGPDRLPGGRAPRGPHGGGRGPAPGRGRGGRQDRGRLVLVHRRAAPLGLDRIHRGA